MSHGDDARWMALALSAARRARPSPNPPVGALVVAGGELLALGWHERAGGPHAEVVALAIAGNAARGATLYVTLEPCNHHGRTPPCVDAVLAAGVRRVVVGCRDPNPHVAGGGGDRLRRCGLAVDVDVMRAEASELISPWRCTYLVA
jgi:diaminohydroxyphosphoribosylaminopyrimidine deaminase/5-amino-6-(5-phosphoribosylamino)uracil reductase